MHSYSPESFRLHANMISVIAREFGASALANGKLSGDKKNLD